MTRRAIPLQSVKRGDKTRSGFILKCSRCPATIDMVCTGTRLSSGEVMQNFRRKGWSVGERAADDLCRACADAARARRAAPPATDLPATPVAEAEPMIAAPPAPPIELRAEAPPTMTREDRRIIFAKVNDVYIDEATGYSAGWSDRRVATDLNVPVAWVRAVRGENFGPEGLSETDRAVIEEAEKIRAAVDEIKARVANFVDQANADMATLQDRLAIALRDVAAVRRTVAWP